MKVDKEWATRVTVIQGDVRRALKTLDPRASVTDVMSALLMHAIALAKSNASGLDEDEFFDLVVKMYEWVSVEIPEEH